MKLMDHTRLWFLILPYFVAGIDMNRFSLGFVQSTYKVSRKKFTWKWTG